MIQAASYLGERCAEEMLSECRKYGRSYRTVEFIPSVPEHHETLLEDWFGTAITPGAVDAYVRAFKVRVEQAYDFDPLLYPGVPGR